jgi:hypothetical protein
MFARSAKWTSVLLLVLCLGLLTSGCFGGGGSATTTAATNADGTATTVAGAGNGPGLAEGTPIRASDEDPADFSDALQKRPIVVLFYVAGNADDTAVLDSVNRLRTSFNSYAFLLYDYKDPSAYGSLAQELNVEYAPFLALIDGSGILRNTFVGFVDEGTLNQSLVNLGR